MNPEAPQQEQSSHKFSLRETLSSLMHGRNETKGSGLAGDPEAEAKLRASRQESQTNDSLASAERAVVVDATTESHGVVKNVEHNLSIVSAPEETPAQPSQLPNAEAESDLSKAA